MFAAEALNMILNLNKSELRVWLSLTFILSQFVLKVLNQEIATSTSSMSCVCDGNCERVQESECPWGITLDVCGCCFVCARGENEPCGGALGNCAAGLNCQLEEGEGSESEKTGTCTSKRSSFRVVKLIFHISVHNNCKWLK